MQSNIDRLIVGVDVSKHNLDVAFWQGEKSIFLGKFTNNYDGFQNVVKHIQKQISEINVQPHSVFTANQKLDQRNRKTSQDRPSRCSHACYVWDSAESPYMESVA